MAKEFGATHTQLLGALTAAGLISTVLAPFLGRFVDRYGARVAITVGLATFGVTLILTSRINTIWQFYLLYSLGLGFCQTSVMRLGAASVAANWFVKWRGVAFAIPLSATAIAGSVYVLGAQAIVDLWSWRIVWLIMGLGLLGIAAPLAWLVIRRRPEDLGLFPDGAGSANPTELHGGSKGVNIPVSDISWTLGEAIRTRAFWILNFSVPLTGFAGLTIFIVMHPYFTQLGFSPTTAAQLVSFYAFASLLGTAIGATLIQLLSVRRLLVPLTAIYGAAIVLFIISGSAIGGLYLSLLILGLAVASSGQLGIQVWADFFGRSHLGTIIGVTQIFRAVTLLGPIIAGMLRDTTGSYIPSFWLFGFFCFVASFGYLFVKPPKKSAGLSQ